jgi:uncharacterized membrane protein
MATTHMPALAIFSRWLHVISACLLIGGWFFMRFVLPRGLRLLDETQAKTVLIAVRRTFKMAVHSAILLLILTGAYNSWLAWDKYELNPALLHPLWGTHVLLALVAIGIALYVLAGKEPRASHGKFIALNFIVLLLAVAVASSVKWARERAVAEHSISTSLPDKQ